MFTDLKVVYVSCVNICDARVCLYCLADSYPLFLDINVSTIGHSLGPISAASPYFTLRFQYTESTLKADSEFTMKTPGQNGSRTANQHPSEQLKPMSIKTIVSTETAAPMDDVFH